MKLYLRESVLLIARAQAAEIFPQEAIGFLLGSSSEQSIYADNIYTFQSARKRSMQTVVVPDEPENRVRDILEEDIIADWHSHCNEPPTASRIRDFTRKEDREQSDEWGMRYDPDYPGHSLILSIWPAKVGWKIGLAYYYFTNRIRKGHIEII